MTLEVVLDLGPMYATDTSDIKHASSLNAPYPRGGGIIIIISSIDKFQFSENIIHSLLNIKLTSVTPSVHITKYYWCDVWSRSNDNFSRRQQRSQLQRCQLLKIKNPNELVQVGSAAYRHLEITLYLFTDGNLPTLSSTSSIILCKRPLYSII